MGMVGKWRGDSDWAKKPGLSDLGVRAVTLK